MEVARGMGLDDRIGPKFLQPGIGFGGSCFAPDETVLARHRGQTKLLSFEALWERLEEHGHEPIEGMIAPDDLEVLSWVHDEAEPRFMPVMLTTRRDYRGDLLEVRTKMGRRLRTTPDHPFVVSDGQGGQPVKKLARDLTTDDWLPIALGRSEPTEAGRLASLMGAVEAAKLHPAQVIVRLGEARTADLVGAGMSAQRRYDVRHSGTLRLAEAALEEGVDLRGSALGTARNGAYVTSEIELGARFWRVVGLYLAEGHASLAEGETTTRRAGRRRTRSPFSRGSYTPGGPGCWGLPAPATASAFPTWSGIDQRETSGHCFRASGRATVPGRSSTAGPA
jgi:UDPglucose 6-dehydrogenase